MNLRQRIILTIVAYPVIVYTIAYISVCLNPYWYDNSPRPEYIPPADRWGWALLISFFFVIYGFPLLVAVIGLMIYLSQRKR
jgi:cytochrome b561